MMSPKARQSTYLIGTIATSVVTLLALWTGVSGEVTSSIVTLITAVCGLLGAGATVTATAAVTRQQKQGAFDEVSPVEQVINGIQATVDQINNATNDFERVKDAVSGVLRDVPVVGPLAQQVIDSAKLP